MSGKLVAWNSLPDEEARGLVRARPLEGRGAVLRAAEKCWIALAEADWLEAIGAHPAIGAPDLVGLAAREQSSVQSASLDTLASLAEANRDYRDRFGWIFLVCARGKTAEEMLSLCRERLHNEPRTELGVAAEEQKKITRLRLEDWLA
jgi:OHCU decarboxylase